LGKHFTGQAQRLVCLRQIAPRLNIKYGFNPDGIKRKTNSIGQAGKQKGNFWMETIWLNRLLLGPKRVG